MTDKTTEPLEFLQALMEGQDTRYRSELLDMVEEIDADNFGDAPDLEQWEALCKLIKQQYAYKPVTVSASLTAAKTIAEYTHAKRKSIELTDGTEKIDVPDLTEDELELFEAWFNDQF